MDSSIDRALAATLGLVLESSATPVGLTVVVLHNAAVTFDGSPR